jgi:hypothetical protein
VPRVGGEIPVGELTERDTRGSIGQGRILFAVYRSTALVPEDDEGCERGLEERGGGH